MPIRVKMTKEEVRQWKNVASVLVGPDGAPLRDIEELERKILTELSKRAREKRRGVEWQSADKTKTIRVSPVEESPGVVKWKKTIDGMTIENGRTLLKKKFFEKYGECQLRKPSGHFHAAIRNPAKEETSEEKPSLRTRRERILHGGNLRDFGKPKLEETFGGEFVEEEKRSARGAKEKAKSLKASPLVSPEKCDCQKWAKTTGSVDGEHHPICGKREAWEKENGRKNGKMLVDLTTREVLREATSEEVGLAGDMGVLQVGDTAYGVVSESELPDRTPQAASPLL